MTTDEDEREYCENAVYRCGGAADVLVEKNVTEMLILQRAAVRAECEAKYSAQLEQTRKCEIAAYDDIKRLRTELTLANARWDRVCTWYSDDRRYVHSKGSGVPHFPSMILFKELVDAAQAYAQWHLHGLASESDRLAHERAYDNLMDAIRHAEGPRA